MADANLPRADFYVYVLFRHDTGEPFYVGKGAGRRWERHENSAPRGNPYLNAIIGLARKAGTKVPKIKVALGLTEAAAFAVERAFIAAIGRKPAGPLANMT